MEFYATPDPEMTVRAKTTTTILDEQISVYDIGFVILEQTSVLISKDIPFPLGATVYDSHRIIPTTPGKTENQHPQDHMCQFQRT